MDLQLLVTLMLTVVLELVLAMPVVRYLTVGWFAKREDILGGQSANARRMYFKMFARDKASGNDTSVLEEFASIYSKRYGRKLYIAPSILLLVVGAIDATLAIGSILKTPALAALHPRLISLDVIGISALTGAYMWVVNDFIWRVRRLDFAPSDVHWGVLRLAMALPLGTAFASIVPEDGHKAFVAFALGAFPLTTLMTMLNRIATTKWLGFAESAEKAKDGIGNLQGVNREIRERLANEDITTITQVAFCDPVRLAMRSNLQFTFITDVMNQALAWAYLEEDVDKIRRLGLKGAVEIRHLLRDLLNPQTQARAKTTLSAAAMALGQSEESLLTVFYEIRSDSFSRYLYAVWD